MKILGIDPGTATTGFAILERLNQPGKKCPVDFKVIDFGCIITEPTFSAPERLKEIHQKIIKLIEKHKPDILSIETLFFFKNLKTVMPVSQARGVILLAAAQKNIPCSEFTPLQVKMTITGYGRADKKQILHMIKEILDLSQFDMKKNYRKKDDAIDALGIGICAGLHNKNLLWKTKYWQEVIKKYNKEN